VHSLVPRNDNGCRTVDRLIECETRDGFPVLQQFARLLS
jgi:hypothetical protein